MSMNITELLNLSEVDLNKLTKSEIVSVITSGKWQAIGWKRQSEELSKQLDENRTNERAACVMLAAFVGVELNRNEYNSTIDSKNLNILELAGLVAAKCVSTNSVQG